MTPEAKRALIRLEARLNSGEEPHDGRDAADFWTAIDDQLEGLSYNPGATTGLGQFRETLLEIMVTCVHAYAWAEREDDEPNGVKFENTLIGRTLKR